jgi:hypothetical protein
MMKVFKKVKLSDDHTLKCDYSETITLEDGRHVEMVDSKTIKAQLHPDLINAFKKLRIHYALISCQIPDDLVNKNMFNQLDAYELKELRQFVCNQVIVTQLGDDDAYQLAGRRIIKQNKVINWTTPPIRPSSEADYYDYKIDLHNDVQNVLLEAEECLAGKYTETTQMEIEDKIEMN